MFVLMALTLAMVGALATQGPFWSLPSSFLRGSAAAGGIALINTIASLGGFVGPTIIGVLKEQTGGYASAMAMLAIVLLISAVIVLAVGRAMRAARGDGDAEGGCCRMTDDRVFAKCAWRLIPFMGLLYFANFIDRVNVGFAALTMNKDLGFSPAVFGFGAGVFFIGYALFQVPANVILERVGARRWIFCIMATWGLSRRRLRSYRGPTVSTCFVFF